MRHFSFKDPTPIFIGDSTGFQMDDLSRSARLRSQIQLSPQLLLRTGIGATLAEVSTRQSDQRLHERLTRNMTAHLEWEPHPKLLCTSGGRVEHTPLRTEFVPRAGIRYRTSEHLHFTTNWSRFFRLPSLDELYYQGVGISGNLTSARNAGKALMLGFISRHGHRVTKFSLTAFTTGFPHSYSSRLSMRIDIVLTITRAVQFMGLSPWHEWTSLPSGLILVSMATLVNLVRRGYSLTLSCSAFGSCQCVHRHTGIPATNRGLRNLIENDRRVWAQTAGWVSRTEYITQVSPRELLAHEHRRREFAQRS